MIRIKLREAIDAHERRTHARLTYKQIADLAGCSQATIESIGARPGYNATLALVDRLCSALGCTLGELLDRAEDELAGC